MSMLWRSYRTPQNPYNQPWSPFCREVSLQRPQFHQKSDPESQFLIKKERKQIPFYKKMAKQTNPPKHTNPAKQTTPAQQTNPTRHARPNGHQAAKTPDANPKPGGMREAIEYSKS